MPDAIVIDAKLTENLSAALGRAIEAAIDLTPAMRDIAGHLADETRERFETGKGPDGVPWRPSRRVLGLDGSREGHGPFRPDGQTLVDTGDLLASIRESWSRDEAAAGPEASGGAAIYAAIHQFGGTITPKAGREGKDGHAPALKVGGRYLSSVVIPARPYLGFTAADGEYATQVIADHLAKSLGSGGASA